MKTLLLSFFLLTATQAAVQSDSEPDQIIEIFRHGARAPLSGGGSQWPAKTIGMLTPVGMRQHYLLGQAIAQKYPTLIGNAYDYNQVYTLSDNVPRCIQSAGAHLYGMYLGKGPSLSSDYPADRAVPPFEDSDMDQMAGSLMDSEALPYNYVPPVINVVTPDQQMFTPWGVCYKGLIYGNDQIKTKSEEEAFNNKSLEMFNDTIININKHLDQKDQIDLSSLGNYINLALSNYYANISMPGNITDPDLFTNLTWANARFFVHGVAYNPHESQVGAFLIVDAMLQQLTNFRQGENYNTAVFYSGHDINLVYLLAIFGVINDQCIMDNFYSDVANGTLVHPTCVFPDFAANMIIEFYNQTATPYVRLLYNDMPITICNGEYTCGYDEFLEYARNAAGGYTAADYKTKCDPTNSKNSTVDPQIHNSTVDPQTSNSTADPQTSNGTAFRNKMSLNLIASIFTSVGFLFLLAI